MTYNTKTGNEKTILRIWITIIRFSLGHEVQESWPYLTSSTHVKNEFSLVGLTVCQYENG